MYKLCRNVWRSIGLIEAMGLYILPARLKRQLAEIQDVLLGKTPYNKEEFEKPEHSLFVHRFMIEELVKKHGTVRDENKAKEIVTAFVNGVCVEILKNTAVFKQDEKGVKALNKFLATLNIK